MMPATDEYNRKQYVAELEEDCANYSKAMVEAERRANKLEKEAESLRNQVAALHDAMRTEYKDLLARAEKAEAEAERDALRERVARTECTCGAAKMPFWRCCKTLEPVAKVHINRTGGNVGIAWHAIGIDGSLPALADGEVLYVLRTALEGK